MEIGREGNVLMRRNAEEDIHVQEKPMYGRRAAEAREAFDAPAKIDDSPLANWNPRMPDFIEKYPIFYACLFVAMGCLVFIGVCLYVYMEDREAEEKRQRRAMANARRQVAQAAAYSQKRAAAFAPAGFPIVRTQQPAAEAKAAARRPAHAAPKAAAPPGDAKAPKAGGRRSQETTSASGNSTPRSATPSENSWRSSGAGDANRQPAISVIRNGTVLTVKTAEVIFASATSWQAIGELAAGQQVTAAGPPEMADDYTMVPIKPKGAVDLKVLQVMRGSEWQ
jgi:Tfp pilus assembly protein PilV